MLVARGQERARGRRIAEAAAHEHLAERELTAQRALEREHRGRRARRDLEARVHVTEHPRASADGNGHTVHSRVADRPLLLLDIDGVISLFGFDRADPPPGVPALIEGVPHRLSPDAASARSAARRRRSSACGARAGRTAPTMNLPHLRRRCPRGWPHIEFGQGVARDGRHWKLDAIDAFAGPERARWRGSTTVTTSACAHWLADAPPGRRLLVAHRPARPGLLDEHVEQLEAWAASCATALS